LIDYNFWCFKKGIQDVFDLGKKRSTENGDVLVNGVAEGP